jgi:predicted phosphodiesterase
MLPKPIFHFDNWGAVQLEGPARVLVLSDVHSPYHSETGVQIALNHGVEQEADVVLLNGDILDFYAASKWEKDPRKRNLEKEIETGIGLLEYIRETFPSARIIYKEGNHEERWESFLIRKAPELLGVKKFSWQAVFELDRLKIEWVGEKRPIRLGKLNVVHGHEYRFAIAGPVNAARGLFNKAKAHALCGHFHQTHTHSETTIEQKLIATFSTGCLCDLHPEYMPLNNWNQGFADVDVTATGNFHVQNLKIDQGELY